MHFFTKSFRANSEAGLEDKIQAWAKDKVFPAAKGFSVTMSVVTIQTMNGPELVFVALVSYWET